MTYLHGKAISGGRALSEEELEGLAVQHFTAMQETFAAQPAIEKTDDVLSLRLGEELRLVKRMLELAQAEMERVGKPAAAKALQQSEDAIEDIAEVIEADDRCDAVEAIDPDLARRLTRRSIDGPAPPCDNRPIRDK